MTDAVNQAERDSQDAEVAPYIGQEFEVDKHDCCLSVRFTARLLGIKWTLDTYTGGPYVGQPFWYMGGYEFDNGVVVDMTVPPWSGP